MVTYASGAEASGLFVLVFAVVAAITAGTWYVAWRAGSRRRALAAILAIALLVPLASSGWMIKGRQSFADAVSAAQGPTNAQQAAAENSLAVNKRLLENGAVLLENREQALPLDPAGTPKINVFGMGSVKTQFTTSLRGADPRNNPNIVTLTQALERSGFQVNRDLTSFYEVQLPAPDDSLLYPMPGDKGDIIEVDPREYDDLIAAATDYSDTALLVITRQGGEGGDLCLDMDRQPGGDPGKHYLELQDIELDLLHRLTTGFDRVIILVNSASPMELGFLDDPEISAALWIGEPGDNGFEGVAALLTGLVSPSGRLVDTWAFDATSAPSFKNFGDFRYLREDGKDAVRDSMEAGAFASYVDYEEGIYVGYRYYETRWADDDGRGDEAAYRSAVQYPFGYGLSYTEFDQRIVGFSTGNAPGDSVTVTVEVANTGQVPGRDVAQIYAQPPYHPGGIEKSRVELVGFASTGVLEPGQSARVDISFAVEDLASYDYIDAGAWVLEAGTYQIALQSNAHDTIEIRPLEVPATIVFDDGQPRSTDRVAATNRFDDIGGNDMIQLSRADWEGTEPTERRQRKVASPELLEQIKDKTATFPDVGAAFQLVRGDLKLADLTGAPADDPLWDRYMEQFTPEDLSGLVGLGGWVTEPIPSQGVPRSHAVDGPVGVIDYTTGTAGIGFASTVVLASTFDVELVEEFGQALGAEAVALGYQGLYSPGMNMHRSPFGGRNFEYYSEDPRLSGLLAAATVRGYRAARASAHIKHFAVNDQETNREGVATWLNEQALREIYLEPFEIAIKQGGAPAMMGSYNRLGTRWTGAVRELNVDVLRGEWGFEGHLLTDFFFSFHMNVDQAIAGGVDLIESTTGDYPTEATMESDAGLIALRESARHVLYTFANSGVVDVHEPKVTSSDWIAIGTIGVLAVGLSAALLAVTRPGRRSPQR